MVPAALAAGLVVLGIAAALQLARVDLNDMHFVFKGSTLTISGIEEGQGSGNIEEPLRSLVMGVGLLLLTISGIMVCSYLLDSLYAERRDRSILFWRSLPVSDSQAVLAKYSIALLVPLAVYALTVLTTAILLLLLSLTPQLAAHWPPTAFAQYGSALAELGATMLLNLLWYAPLYAVLQLASLARRTPTLWVLLVPVGCIIAEKLLLGSAYLAHWIGQRLAPLPLQGVQQPGLWLGVLAAAAVLALTVRLRRYSDDS
jgi:ABC-2 type transport system permease protein